MTMEKKLLLQTKEGFIVKDIKIFDDPNKMRPMFNDIRWKILEKLAQEPRFPADLAREMGLHEQKVYYHIRQLIDAGLVQVAREEEIRGATAKFYSTTQKAFGIELDPQEQGMPITLDNKIQTVVFVCLTVTAG